MMYPNTFKQFCIELQEDDDRKVVLIERLIPIIEKRIDINPDTETEYRELMLDILPGPSYKPKEQ